jgi:hypothetical protein
MEPAAPITITIRQASAAEADALAAWTAHFLPQCQTWLARHGFHPPADVIAGPQTARLDGAMWTPEDLAPLLLRRAGPSAEPAPDRALEHLAAQLRADLATYQQLRATTAVGEQPAASTRDMRRFLRVKGYLAPGGMFVARATSVLIPAFSPPQRTLYAPGWLLDDLPAVAFAPTATFPAPRRTSMLWFLFDAIVLPSGERFQTL